MQDAVFLVLLAIAVVPIIVYLSVKLGVVAYYRGKSISRQLDKENRNGESERSK